MIGFMGNRALRTDNSPRHFKKFFFSSNLLLQFSCLLEASAVRTLLAFNLFHVRSPITELSYFVKLGVERLSRVRCQIDNFESEMHRDDRALLCLDESTHRIYFVCPSREIPITKD
jgi:hypothetical protein